MKVIQGGLILSEIELPAGPLSGMEGLSLTSVTFDSNIVLSFGHDSEYRLRIFEDHIFFEDREPLVEVVVQYAAWAKPPEIVSGVNEVLSLVNRQLTDANMETSGKLTLNFDGGLSMRAVPEGEFESWTLEGPESTLICMGSGELIQFGTV